MPSEASPGAWGVSSQEGKLIATLTIILPIVTAHEGYSYALFLWLRSFGWNRAFLGGIPPDSPGSLRSHALAWRNPRK
jgi:hypothetical protein